MQYFLDFLISFRRSYWSQQCGGRYVDDETLGAYMEEYARNTSYGSVIYQGPSSAYQSSSSTAAAAQQHIITPEVGFQQEASLITDLSPVGTEIKGYLQFYFELKIRTTPLGNISLFCTQT